MGQNESHASSPQAHDSTSVAFHVLRVAEHSPAAQAGIDPFFDFVCGVNGSPLGEDIDTLTDILEKSENQLISLQVWSTKRKELRDVDLIPNRTWSSSPTPSSSSSAAADSQPSLLGLSLRLCHPQHALEQVWHVLEILEGSPAQSAGLVPFGDWIVGYAGGVLRGEGDFYDVVESHVDKPLRLFVYNADYDVTRETILVPNRNWGGNGLLGCGVGYGLLHRIPRPQDRKLVSETEEEVEVIETGRGGGGGGGGGGYEGYEEAGYGSVSLGRSAGLGVSTIGGGGGGEEDYDPSEGVEVIPVQTSGGDEGDMFVPMDDTVRGGGGVSKGTPKKQMRVPFGVDRIEEEY